MRRLMLLRHATAVPHGVMPDFERHLAPQGLEEAASVARYCADEMLLPDAALVSAAVRTQQTWQAVAGQVSGVWSLSLSALYPMQVDELLQNLQSLTALTNAPEVEEARCLMLVGHNPTMTELAQRLVGFGDRYAFARLRGDFPPAGLAVLDFDIDHWSDIAAGQGRLDRFWVPATIN
jgi:phosphohistidine phosphatase